ncbi:MAG TPA: OmpA family protein [Kofleriaceae bacterium]|nr:OmpA family protein [Kofleriaceae bacterium]
MRKPLLAILAIAIPTGARAEPEAAPELEPPPADAGASACEDPGTCAAMEFADALSSQPAKSQVRLDSRIAFEPGRVRVYSRDREKLRTLAASWRRNHAWATITVEGYADASDDGGLAQRRADKIFGYLVRYGVDAEYVIAVAHDPARGDARNEPAVAGHVDLTIEHCPRGAAECRRKPVKPRTATASTVK